MPGNESAAPSHNEQLLEVSKLRQALADKEAALGVAATTSQDPTVPEIEALLAKVRTLQGDDQLDALEQLSDMVGAAFDEEGAAIGNTVRVCGGVSDLARMLSDPSPQVQNEVLVMLGNLCSNAVDPNSQLTKNLLLQSGAAEPLVACLQSADAALLTCATGCLQNLCHDVAWSSLIVSLDAEQRLEELLRHHEPMVVRYASGAPAHPSPLDPPHHCTPRALSPSAHHTWPRRARRRAEEHPRHAALHGGQPAAGRGHLLRGAADGGEPHARGAHGGPH